MFLSIQFVTVAQDNRVHAKEVLELIELRKENDNLKVQLTSAQKRIDDLIVIGAKRSRALCEKIISCSNTITLQEYKVSIFLINLFLTSDFKVY
jgi:hypothetical protein